MYPTPQPYCIESCYEGLDWRQYCQWCPYYCPSRLPCRRCGGGGSGNIPLSIPRGEYEEDLRNPREGRGRILLFLLRIL